MTFLFRTYFVIYADNIKDINTTVKSKKAKMYLYRGYFIFVNRFIF
jgi:hypothetical protein